MLCKGMTRKDFLSWNLSDLQGFLADRDINKMNLKISATAYIEEKNEVELNFQSKLVLENGLVNLPDCSKLIGGWFTAPYNLPNTIYEQVNTYLRDTDAGKSIQGREVLAIFRTYKECDDSFNKLKYSLLLCERFMSS